MFSDMKDQDDAGGQLPKKKERKHFVLFDRDPSVAKSRLELPVCMHEQEIMEAVHATDVVLVSGATGTGKTTQMPQFLLEDGFGDPRAPVHKGMVAVTQPRRVAAVTCAHRVAYELKSEVGDIIGYQIRHEAKLGPNVRAKFATDGILLREVESDILLRRYSAVIIDEVHERSLNTDLLLSFLSRTVALRRENPSGLGPLKVIVMSATLDVEGVFRGEAPLFPNPPVVKVPSRQYSVTLHFAKKTPANYVDEAYQKVEKIHRRLPRGEVLVFLTGRQEVDELCTRLKETFSTRTIQIHGDNGAEIGMKVLPFYALLPDRQQRAVFDDFGEDIRKVVVATNIAETSVTVPGVCYVVDSGRVKEKVYKGEGSHVFSSFDIRWVSKASADQRAGRAGRTGPGHCYRLYSSAVYDRQFEAFREPEILRTPTDAVVMRLRAMGIRNVAKFPFPTRPSEKDIAAAEKLLTDLGALYAPGRIPSLDIGGGFSKGASTDESNLLGVTKIGRSLAQLPVPPRFGRMLLSARTSRLPLSTDERNAALRYTCRIAGILTVGSVCDRTGSAWREKHLVFRHRRSDLLSELSAVCGVEHAGIQGLEERGYTVKGLNHIAMRDVCSSHFLYFKSVTEVLQVSYQLEKSLWGGKHPPSSSLVPPNGMVEECLLRSILTGFPDRIARRMTRREGMSMNVIPRRRRKAFTVLGTSDAVYLEDSSSIFLSEDVEYVCYSNLNEVRSQRNRAHGKEPEKEQKDDYEESSSDEAEINGNDSKVTSEAQGSSVEAGPIDPSSVHSRIVMRGASVISASWITTEATGMCYFDLPTEATPETEYDSQLDTVVEDSRVRYGHWALGRAKVPIGLLALSRNEDIGSASSDRTRRHFRAFALGILNGKARVGMAIDFSKDGSDRSGAVCVQRVAETLRNHRCPLSLDGLCLVLSTGGDFLTPVVEACIIASQRKRISSVWKAEIAHLLKDYEARNSSDKQAEVVTVESHAGDDDPEE